MCWKWQLSGDGNGKAYISVCFNLQSCDSCSSDCLDYFCFCMLDLLNSQPLLYFAYQKNQKCSLYDRFACSRLHVHPQISKKLTLKEKKKLGNVFGLNVFALGF